MKTIVFKNAALPYSHQVWGVKLREKRRVRLESSLYNQSGQVEKNSTLSLLSNIPFSIPIKNSSSLPVLFAGIFFTLYSLLFILDPVIFILYHLSFILYPLFLILYSLSFILYLLFFILYSLYFILYSVSCILNPLSFNLYSFSLFFILYSLFFILYPLFLSFILYSL